VKDNARRIVANIAKLPELAEAASSGGVSFPDLSHRGFV
jgi:hypothetical protein